MKVSTQNPTTSFSGLYKLPYSAENYRNVMYYAIPKYKSVKHEPILLLKSPTPYWNLITDEIKRIAIRNNSSLEWAILNLKYHGADISNLSPKDILVISGKNDTNKIFHVFSKITKHIEKKYENTTILGKLKSLFVINPYQQKISQYPKHLQNYFALEMIINDTRKILDNFIKNKKIINIDNPQDLLTKIIKEQTNK